MAEQGSPQRFELKPWLEIRRARVERALGESLGRLQQGVPAGLWRAMDHSLMGGGKRLRPVLVLGAAEAAGGGEASELVLDFACAVEFVHTYSLIHDDLPAMDDDDLRRGRPTCHVVFGEAMAILAGDGLLTEAFALLGRRADPRRAELTGLLASGAGVFGMVGGQADDILPDRPSDLGFLESLHQRKTGALIAASCAGGALAAGADPEQVARFREYGQRLGLAFQIRDDLIDEDGDPAKIGKPLGSDARNNKQTFLTLLGREGAWQRAREEVAAAHRLVQALGPAAEPLRALAAYAIERDR